MSKPLVNNALATAIGDFVGGTFFDMQNGELDLGILSGNFLKSAQDKRDLGVTPLKDLQAKRQSAPAPAM